MKTFPKPRAKSLPKNKSTETREFAQKLVNCLPEQPKQGLTDNRGEPVFALVFTADDVAGAAHITKQEARRFIRNHADKFVDGFLVNDWPTIIDAVVQSIKETTS